MDVCEESATQLIDIAIVRYKMRFMVNGFGRINDNIQVETEECTLLCLIWIEFSLKEAKNFNGYTVD